MPQASLSSILASYNELMNYEGKTENIITEIDFNYKNTRSKSIQGKRNKRIYGGKRND